MRRLVGWSIQRVPDYGPRTGSGGDDWVERCEILLRRDLRGDDRIVRFRDHPAALGFLRQLATDSRCLSAFRGALAEASSLPPLAQLGDVEVLDQLAWMLVWGRVHVAVRLGARPVASHSVEPAPASAKTIGQHIPKEPSRPTPGPEKPVPKPVAKEPAPKEPPPPTPGSEKPVPQPVEKATAPEKPAAELAEKVEQAIKKPAAELAENVEQAIKKPAAELAEKAEQALKNRAAELAEKVEKALRSGDPDKQLEAEVAKAVGEELIDFGKKIGPNGSIGEIDVETVKAIIEVTTKSKGKLQQIEKLLNNPDMNPSKKPVLLYAPNYKGTPEKDIAKAGAIVVRSKEQLQKALSKL